MARRQRISIDRELAREHGIIDDEGKITLGKPPLFVTPSFNPAALPVLRTVFTLAKNQVDIESAGAVSALWAEIKQAEIAYGVAHGLCDEQGRPLESQAPEGAGADEE